MHLIELKNVSKYYKSEDNVSVGMKNISVSFDFNEFVAVTGKSGSGKTTLLNVISGLDGYEDGEVYINGEETSHYTIEDWERYRAAYVGFVFQNYNIIDSFTVYQNVMLALDIQNYPRKLRKKRALELIDKVGLTSHKNHKAAKLSGGQKQRCVIARALAKDCPIIVADEPTGNLDSETSKQIMELLFEVSKDKLVVVVTHNYSQVEPYATRRIKMHDGLIIEDNKIKEVDKTEVTTDAKPKKMTFGAVVSFAFKNLLAQPKRFLFILILQFLVVGALTFVYTSQIKNIREAGMEYSDLFPYVPETRLLVQRRDGLDLDDSDITYLKGIREVKEVYEKGENFLSNYPELYLRNNSSNRWGYNEVKFVDAGKFLNPRFMKGSIPKNSNEVAVSQNFGFNIGDTVRLLNNYNDYNDDNLIYTFKVTAIVGDDKSALYLSDEFLINKSQVDYINQKVYKNLETMIFDYSYNKRIFIDGVEQELIFGFGDIDLQSKFLESYVYGGTSNSPLETDELKEVTITLNEYMYINGRGNLLIEESVTTKIYLRKNPNYTGALFMPIYVFDQTAFKSVGDLFMEKLEYLAKNDVIDNVSISVSSRAAGLRVLNRIDETRYRVLYPANIKSYTRPIFVFLFTLVAIGVIGLVGTFLYTILHSVTKNVMKSRQKDFAIYRSIGANRRDLGKLVIIEQVILSLLALIIVMIIFNLVSSFVLGIAAIISYLTLSDYLLLFIIFTLFGALLGIRFNRKVFMQTVVETLSLAREDIL